MHDADKDERNSDDEMAKPTERDQRSSTQTRIRLLNGQLTVKCTKWAVIRYHSVPKDKDRQRRFHTLLLLYLPWREEPEDTLCDDEYYEQLFHQHKTTVERNMTHFEKHSEQGDAAFAAVENGSVSEEAWNEIAAEVEQNRLDTEAEIVLDEDYTMMAYHRHEVGTAQSPDYRTADGAMQVTAVNDKQQ